VQREFDDYLECARLKHGFLRVRCEDCHHERLVAFSCKRRGICPTCGARRMAESAALPVDDVLPHQPVRQLSPWMACSRAIQEQLPRVFSFTFQLLVGFRQKALQYSILMDANLGTSNSP
jgi:ribosomal protein S27E